jgi:hypothetical protein
VQLLTLHKVVIAVSVVAAVAFAAFGVYHALTTGSVGYGLAAGASLAVAAGLCVYLRYFARKARTLASSAERDQRVV